MLPTWMFPADNQPIQGGQASDQLASLRELGGWVLVTVAVVIVIAGSISIILWVIGRISAQSRAQATAAGIAFRVCCGAAILGSLGGLVYYGSGVGKFDLMPTAAGQPTVSVTKKPALTTCPKKVKAEGTAAEKALKQMVSEEDFAKATKNGDFNVQHIKWNPKGPDCTAANTISDPCEKVAAVAGKYLPSGRLVDFTNDLEPVNKADCLR